MGNLIVRQRKDMAVIVFLCQRQGHLGAGIISDGNLQPIGKGIQVKVSIGLPIAVRACRAIHTGDQHLICRECGRLSDITLQDMTKEIEESTGVCIESYDLKIYYICEECRKK